VFLTNELSSLRVEGNACTIPLSKLVTSSYVKNSTQDLFYFFALFGQKPAQKPDLQAMASDSQSCPICATTVRPNPRYPNYLCGHCASKAVDAKGRPLSFYNASMSGGLEAKFTDDGSPAEEVTRTQIVFVNGRKCFADEARFGGIVLEAIPEQGEDTAEGEGRS
jgi:hypothetical protein